MIWRDATRPMFNRPRALVVAALVLLVSALRAQSPPTTPAPPAAITSPRQQFGAAVGDDYFLANYTQLEAYWKTLDRQSDRMQLVDMGRTEEGRPQWMAVLSSPDNLRRIDHYRAIAKRLALAEGLTDEQARVLAREGKAIVWIDGGLHATETLGAQQLIELVYQMTSGTDEETLRILDDVVLLAVAANPDGMDLVSDWYMAHGNMNIPVLYNHYAGHDDNRDFYMSALAESTNMNRVMYREWYPQIMYNHHQSGPQGTVMFAPPFRDPFNYNFHPYIPAGIDLVDVYLGPDGVRTGTARVAQEAHERSAAELSQQEHERRMRELAAKQKARMAQIEALQAEAELEAAEIGFAIATEAFQTQEKLQNRQKMAQLRGGLKIETDSTASKR
jgi:hypothetical protein